MLTISCPHCGFAKQVDPSRVPNTVVRVTCPNCNESFPFGRNAADIPDAPNEEHELSIGEDTVDEIAALPKAGFWIRVVATLVDAVVLTVLQVILSFLLGLVTSGFNGGMTEQGMVALSLVYSLFGTMLSMAYYVTFTGHGGQTPGKMAVRVKVIRTDGADITYGRAFFREVLGKFVSGVLLCIGYIMVAFDSQKQGLHDKIADTYVIKL